MTPLLAIDPGAGGGIAWINADGETEAVPMPQTEGDVIELLRSRAIGTAEAYLEDVGKGIMPGRAKAMIRFAGAFP